MAFRKKLSDLLLEQGLITEDQVQDALRIQHEKGVLFGRALVDLGLVSEDEIVSVLIEHLDLPYIRLQDYDIDRELLEIFDPAMMRRYQFVPIEIKDSVLSIAIAGVLNDELLDTFENGTGYTAQPFLVKMSDIDQAIEKYNL